MSSEVAIHRTGRGSGPLCDLGCGYRSPMPKTLYESLSVAPVGAQAIGRTEGTKTQETIDRDRDSTDLELLGTRSARNPLRTSSLYQAFARGVVERNTLGETVRTSAKETLDNDVEAGGFEFALGASVSSPYGSLSVPASSVGGPGRTESTRDARETLDNDRESESLAPLSLG